jgi:hypothetical protein
LGEGGVPAALSHGEVLIFKYNSIFNQFVATQRLLGSSLDAADYFGASVHLGKTVDGTYILAVGAYGASSSAAPDPVRTRHVDTGGAGDDGNATHVVTNRGAVYVFESKGNDFVEVAKLVPSTGSTSDSFGTEVAVRSDGRQIAISSVGRDLNGMAWCPGCLLGRACRTDRHGQPHLDGLLCLGGIGFYSTGSIYIFARAGDGSWFELQELYP